jgi:hypothetical protein
MNPRRRRHNRLRRRARRRPWIQGPWRSLARLFILDQLLYGFTVHEVVSGRAVRRVDPRRLRYDLARRTWRLDDEASR